MQLDSWIGAKCTKMFYSQKIRWNRKIWNIQQLKNVHLQCWIRHVMFNMMTEIVVLKLMSSVRRSPSQLHFGFMQKINSVDGVIIKQFKCNGCYYLPPFFNWKGSFGLCEVILSFLLQYVLWDRKWFPLCVFVFVKQEAFSPPAPMNTRCFVLLWRNTRTSPNWCHKWTWWTRGAASPWPTPVSSETKNSCCLTWRFQTVLLEAPVCRI